MKKVSKIEIERFRGIPTNLILDFCNKAGQLSSMLLLGDNGSGKSTIVDAIEFGLQGRIIRSGNLMNSQIPSVFSLYDKSSASVSIELFPFEQIQRTATLIEENEDIKLIYKGAPHHAFASTPLGSVDE